MDFSNLLHNLVNAAVFAAMGIILFVVAFAVMDKVTP